MITKLPNKLHDWATVVGAGLLGALVATLFGYGGFYFLIHDAIPVEGRETVLVTLPRVYGVLGSVVAILFAAIRGARILHVLIGILVFLCVVTALCLGGHLEVARARAILPALVVVASGLVPAAAVGVMFRRMAGGSGVALNRTEGLQ